MFFQMSYIQGYIFPDVIPTGLCSVRCHAYMVMFFQMSYLQGNALPDVIPTWLCSSRCHTSGFILPGVIPRGYVLPYVIPTG